MIKEDRWNLNVMTKPDRRTSVTQTLKKERMILVNIDI